MLSAIAEGVDEVVVLIDSDGRIQRVLSDTETPSFFNSDPSDVAGQTLGELFTEARVQRFLGTIEEALADGTPQTLNCQKETDQVTRHFAGTVFPVGDNGRHALWIADDATSRQRQQYQQKVLDRVLEVAPLGLVLVEPSGEISQANDRAADLLGLERAEITSRTYQHPEWDIMYDDGTPVPDDEHPVTRTLETGEPVIGFEHWVERPDGSQRWLSSHSAPVLEDGQVQRVVVGLDDATRQKEREQRLEWLLESIQLADIGGWEFDCDTEIVEGTAGMASLHGDDEYRLPLSDALEMYHPADRERVETAIRTCCEDGTSFDVEGRRRTVDGRERWVQVKGERIEDRGSQKIRGIVRDITVSKEHEQRLKVMNRVLRHNIRNRLNIILGHTQLVETELEHLDTVSDIDQLVTDSLATAEGSSGRTETVGDGHSLVEFISDQTDFSATRAQDSIDQIKTASEKLTTLADKVRLVDDALDSDTEPCRVDIGALLAEIKREYSEVFPNSSIEIDYEDIELICNPEIVRLVLAIPVENAIEHSDASTPTVSITASQSAGDPVTISITDNGPGIPETERAFLNGAEETPMAHSSGIGLWTLQWLIRRLGGAVTVATDCVEGTRLELTIPPTPTDRETTGRYPTQIR